jgi:hypothetical protein
MLLANLLLAATVTVSIQANEPIIPPFVEAAVAGQTVTIPMNNPSGDRMSWTGISPDWPIEVTATLEDLAGNQSVTSWTAQAPEIDDVPDIRLGTPSLQGPNPVYPTGFPGASGPLNLFDFVEFNDTPPSVLTFMPVPDAMPSSGPESFNITGAAQRLLSVAQTAEEPYAADVHITSALRPAGWWEVGYTALDGRLVADDVIVGSTGFVKYSTFAVRGPTIESGRFPGSNTLQPPLVLPWMGSDIVLGSLPGDITPPVNVGWSLYLNKLDYYRSQAGETIGINPRRLTPTEMEADENWTVSITPGGTLSVSGNPNSGEGPYMLGVLARSLTNPNDTDTARFLLTKALLAHATSEEPAFTYDRSVSLDGLPLGPVRTPDGPSPVVLDTLYEGCHWGYHVLSEDSVMEPAPLEVVSLSTDPDLPDAAHPNLTKPAPAPPIVAAGTGRALKAFFDQSASSLPVTGVRFLSRAFTDLHPGDVITFAVDIATDVTDATHSPEILMAMTSGWGAAAAGFNLTSLAEQRYPELYGTSLASYQRTLVPLEDEGWRTLSINYTPPATRRYFDIDGDGDCDTEDRDFLAFHPVIGTMVQEEWQDERTVAKASLRVRTREDMTKPFHVWFDNLRVYRSAYELDLALGRTEFSEPADLTGTGLPPGFVPQPSAALDSTFESLGTGVDPAVGLDAAGWMIGAGDGPAPLFVTPPFGTLPVGAFYAAADPASFGVAQGINHSPNPNDRRALRISLTGDEGPASESRAIRAQLNTAAVAVPGSGIYCVEAFVSKERQTDRIRSDRSPVLLLGLNELDPNPLVATSGTVFSFGGLPESVWDQNSNWSRVVATAYIPDARVIRGLIQVKETFTDHVTDFDVPIYIDDFRIYRLEDPVEYFDADLFDAS